MQRDHHFITFRRVVALLHHELFDARARGAEFVVQRMECLVPRSTIIVSWRRCFTVKKQRSSGLIPARMIRNCFSSLSEIICSVFRTGGGVPTATVCFMLGRTPPRGLLGRSSCSLRSAPLPTNWQPRPSARPNRLRRAARHGESQSPQALRMTAFDQLNYAEHDLFHRFDDYACRHAA